MQIKNIQPKTMYGRYSGQKIYGKVEPCFVIDNNYYEQYTEVEYAYDVHHRVVDVGGVQDIEEYTLRRKVGTHTRFRKTGSAGGGRYDSRAIGVLCLVLRNVPVYEDGAHKRIVNEQGRTVRVYERKWCKQVVASREIRDMDPWAHNEAYDQREREAKERQAREQAKRKAQDEAREQRMVVLKALGVLDPEKTYRFNHGEEITLSLTEIDNLVALIGDDTLIKTA